MNPIQTAIANLFRIPVRQPRQRSYAGAKRDGVSMSGWTTNSGSADSEIWGALSTLRKRSWDLYRNDPNVTGAINDIVSETIGNGILLQSKITKKRGKGLDLKLNTAIEDAFNRWASNPKWCDAAGKLTFWKMQKVILLSVLVSGEVLVRFVKRRFDDSPLPFALEIIEADQLDENYTNGRTGIAQTIRMGVEVNEWNRPVAYWVLPAHPGDPWTGQSYSPQRIPASEILHIFNWRGYRPGQTRGVPALHSVIVQSRNLLGYQESEVVKARIQSCIGAFFENEQSDELALPQDDDGFFYRQFEPGMMEDLPPGKRIVPFDPSSPNPNLPEFVRTMQRAIARGLNTSSYLVSGDLADANYSSMRVGLLQQRKQFEILRDDLNEDFNHKIYREFLKQATLSGFLSMPGDFDYNQDFYIKDTWVGDAWPWVDPSKDVNAKKTELEMGTTTITQILKEKGVDIEEHFAELAQEKELRKQYGIEEPTPDGQPPQETPNDEPAPLVEGMQAVNPQPEEPAADTPPESGRSYDDVMPPITPEVLPPEEPEKPCCKECEEKEDDDDDDKNITINISINGNQLAAAMADPESEPEDDDEEEDDDIEEMAETAIAEYTLLPGFSPVREMYGERKIKPKKKKNCTNGQVCGFSCISKSKTCIANMTTAQLMAHNEAKRAERREKAKAKKAAATGGGIMPSSEVKTYQEAIERGKAIAKDFTGNPITAQQKQIMASLEKELDDLRDEMASLSEDIYDNYSKFSELEIIEKDKRLSQLTNEVWQKATDLNFLKSQDVDQVNYYGLMDKIKSLSGIDASKAKEITEKIYFDPTLAKPRQLDGKRYKHDLNNLKLSTEEFMMIAGDKVQIDKIFQDMKKDGKRAYARGKSIGFNENSINIGTPAKPEGGIKTTLFHELAHHIEFQNPSKSDIALDWVKSRSTSSSPQWLGKGYKKYEVAYPDQFIYPYVGKSYEKFNMKATEVISMGLEHFSSPKRINQLYNKDKDHFYLTLGLIAG